MNRTHLPVRWIITVTILALAGDVACSHKGRGDNERTNIVLFIIDDLGWMDTGVYGSSFYETPNIDRLLLSGARFTQFYAASPVCSPTRASIMTGKHPARLQITNWIGGEQNGRLLQAEYRRRLPLGEVTLGEAFGEAGYATGYIGKWHLGAEGYLPDSQGFDTAIAVNRAGQPGSYFYPYENDDWPVTNVPGLDGGPGDYLTDRLTDEALAYIDKHASEPFFLVLSHYAVHTPLQSKDSLTLKYEAKAAALPPLDEPAMLPEGARAQTKRRQDHAVYAGMIESTDQSVGRVLDKLDQLRIASRTVVVFVSDNGGLSTLATGRTGRPTSNLPLRAGKGWLYEGGVRVPLIVRWPVRIVGPRAIDQPAVSMDLYPTLLELAGIPLRPGQHVDGVSLVPLLEGWSGTEREALFWHFPHYHGSGNVPSGAIRVGDYKLVEWFEDGRIELYDLADDLGEGDDLATIMPEKAEELKVLLLEWRRRIGAAMPSPNPGWTRGGSSSVR